MTDENNTDDEPGVYEVQVEQTTSKTFAIRANSRQEAWEAIEDVNKPRSVQSMLARADFSSLSERRPIDARHAPEYEDNDELDVDVDLTADEGGDD